MPDLEIDPGDYRERKPKGWRWRLPWSHPVSARTPLAMLCVMLLGLGYIYLNRVSVSADLLFAATAFAAFIAGGMFILAFHDN